jgi:hypothetical protein
MIVLPILVDYISELLSANYTQVKVYSDESTSGSFATLAGTVALQGGKQSYEFVDVSGTPGTTWYKTSYFGASASPTESAKSAAILGGTSTSYASVREFKNQVGKVQDYTDVQLQAILDAASRLIDRICNRKDGFLANPTASARLFSGSGTFVQFIDQFAAVSLVEVKSSPSDSAYVTWSSGDYIPFAGDEVSPDFNPLPFEPYIGLMVTATGTSRIFTSGLYANWRGFSTDLARLSNKSTGRSLPTVRITANWGFGLTVPDVVKQACLTQASRWWKRGASGWSDSMANSDTGVMTYRKTMDPDVKLMLENGRLIRPAIG